MHLQEMVMRMFDVQGIEIVASPRRVDGIVGDS
jgi:hypothetical protein